MAFDAGAIQASLTLDRSGFSSALSGARSEAAGFSAETAQQMQSVGGAMMGVGGVITAGVTLPIVGAGVAAVKMAGDAEAATTRMGVNFGAAEDDMMSFLTNLQETTPAAMTELQNAASGAQGSLTTLGIEQGQANQMTKEALEVASNLSAHMNIPFTQALEAVQAGYAGNTDSLRNMAYNISQAEINSKALEMGLIGEKQSADGAARAQAVHALVLEQSAGIMNSAQKNAGTFNMQLRRLWANVQDLGAQIGTLLLPVLKPMVGLLASMVNRFAQAPVWLQYTILGVAGLAAAVGPLVLGLGGLIYAVGTISLALAPGGALAVGLPIITGAFGGLSTLLTATVIPTLYRMGVAMWASLGPMALVVAGVAAVAGAAYLIYRNWGSITSFFGGLWQGVKDMAMGVADWFRGLPAAIQAGIMWGLRLNPITGPIFFFFEQLVPAIKSLLGISSPSTVFAWIGEMVVHGFIEGLYNRAEDLWDSVKSLFGGAVDWVKNLLGISSPSDTGRWIGQMFGLGAALGIDDALPGVRKAADRMAASVGAPRIGSLRSAGGAASTGGGRRGRRGPKRSRERPVVEVSIGGSRFQQEISNAVYEAIRRDILAGEGY